MANRHQKATINEEQNLSQFDYLHRIDVPGRFEYHEQGVVVDVELGALVGVDGILNCQFVEPELFAYRFELLLGWFVEPDPAKGLAVFARFQRALQDKGLGPALALGIESGVDDHLRKLTARTPVRSVRTLPARIPLSARL
jgi:hypothetical protein